MISDNTKFIVIISGNTIHKDVTDKKYINDPVKYQVMTCLVGIIECQGDRSINACHYYKPILKTY